jgi:pimeloyl-ACP methyl ester carboxylesterase
MTTAPLYLLPGLICDDLVWKAQAMALSDFDAVAIKGYDNARTLVQMAERVFAEAPDTFTLAGHSMGGRVALEMIRMAPARIERLALLDTGVHPVEPGEKEKRMALLEIGRQKGMEALVDVWLPPMVHPDRRSEDAFMAPLRKMCVNAGLGQFENQIAALLGRSDQAPILASIRCPTLVAVGSEDAWSPVAQHREIASQIRDAEFVVFEGAGHMAPVESPDRVSDALRRWLERDAS